VPGLWMNVDYGSRSFAVAGPTAWNNLSEYLRDPELSTDNSRRQLKTFLFAHSTEDDTPAHEKLFVPVCSVNLLIYITLQIYVGTWATISSVIAVTAAQLVTKIDQMVGQRTRYIAEV